MTDTTKALEASADYQKINAAGPTARELVDAFGEDGLLVELADGSEVPGCVLADGTVSPGGKWRYRVCREDFSPGRNMLRWQLFEEMVEKRRRLQIEQAEERHATTDHVLWTDADGERRSAPAESADQVIRKVGVAPMTHPKVWRPA